MGFNAYPALSIRQPDLGKTLATAALLKTSRLKNRLLEGKLKGQNGLAEIVSQLKGTGGGPAGGDPSSAQVRNALVAGGGP